LHERKETRDNTNCRSQGDGISMVLGEGKKPGAVRKSPPPKNVEGLISEYVIAKKVQFF
jgi:hypothetical protein